MSRRGAFIAKHLRQPTPEEERQLRAEEREDARAEKNQRHETELRRAYVAAGGSKEEFEAVKGELLKKDLAERAVKDKDAASRAQSAIYRQF